MSAVAVHARAGLHYRLEVTVLDLPYELSTDCPRIAAAARALLPVASPAPPPRFGEGAGGERSVSAGALSIERRSADAGAGGRPYYRITMDFGPDGLEHPVDLAETNRALRAAGEQPGSTLGSPLGVLDLCVEVMALAARNARAHEIGCLHAAAVTDGRRAVALIGASHSGKTTLALALGHQGLRVYSDDGLVLTRRDLSFVGWPRLLAPRPPTWELVEKAAPGSRLLAPGGDEDQPAHRVANHRTRSEEPGARSHAYRPRLWPRAMRPRPEDPRRLAALLFLERGPDGGMPALRPILPSQAIARLLLLSTFLRDDPQLSGLRRLAAEIPAGILVTGELALTCARVRALLEDDCVFPG